MNRLYALTLVTLFSASVPLFAQWKDNPSVNTLVTGAKGQQNLPQMVSDGAGGVIVVWQSAQGTSYDIYAQRLSATGVALWKADGVPVCTADSDQTNPVITSDGAGGAIISWWDWRNGNYDVYAQRINGSGVIRDDLANGRQNLFDRRLR